MTDTPNTPLDFTGTLELVCDGTEVKCHPVATWGLSIFRWTAPDGLSGKINSYGRPASDPTGPQIVCNRVEEGCANCHGMFGDLALGRDPEELCDTCYSHATELTPAAPEPDGEVVETDREFAARWIVIAPQNAKLILSGEWDHHEGVQAAKRHRLSSTPPQSGEGMAGELEAMIQQAEQDAIDDANSAIESGERTDLWQYDIEISLDLAKRILAAIRTTTSRREAMDSARVLRFLDDLATADLDDLAADGGVTVGMVFQQDAKSLATAIRTTKDTPRHDD
jgi:hypothetical protein